MIRLGHGSLLRARQTEGIGLITSWPLLPGNRTSALLQHCKTSTTLRLATSGRQSPPSIMFQWSLRSALPPLLHVQVCLGNGRSSAPKKLESPVCQRIFRDVLAVAQVSPLSVSVDTHNQNLVATLNAAAALAFSRDNTVSRKRYISSEAWEGLNIRKHLIKTIKADTLVIFCITWWNTIFWIRWLHRFPRLTPVAGVVLRLLQETSTLIPDLSVRIPECQAWIKLCLLEVSRLLHHCLKCIIADDKLTFLDATATKFLPTNLATCCVPHGKV